MANEKIEAVAKANDQEATKAGVTSVDESNDDTENTVDYWRAKAEQAEAEAAKNRSISKKAIAERDALKKAPKSSEQEEDYKKLWQEEQSARSKLVERTKRADVNNAAAARLTKLGIIPDALEAALGLIDAGKVEWDEDNGVDDVSVNATIATLKNKFPFMFEKKISSTSIKTPAEGKNAGGDENTMSREAFDKLSLGERAAIISKRVKIV